MMALQNSFRGGDDYPKDVNLVMTQNESNKYLSM